MNTNDAKDDLSTETSGGDGLEAAMVSSSCATCYCWYQQTGRTERSL